MSISFIVTRYISVTRLSSRLWACAFTGIRTRDSAYYTHDMVELRQSSSLQRSSNSHKHHNPHSHNRNIFFKQLSIAYNNCRVLATTRLWTYWPLACVPPTGGKCGTTQSITPPPKGFRLEIWTSKDVRAPQMCSVPTRRRRLSFPAPWLSQT